MKRKFFRSVVMKIQKFESIIYKKYLTILMIEEDLFVG